jgi:hypothetical protein
MDTALQELRTALSRAIEGMSAEELARHIEGKWCTAEILDHLNLTYIGTAKNLQRCLTGDKRSPVLTEAASDGNGSSLPDSGSFRKVASRLSVCSRAPCRWTK